MFSFLFCFFKPKTAYDVRISDWSSDVCSSDLHGRPGKRQPMSPACAPVPTPGAMKVIGLAGWSGSGKTTLIVQLIPALVRRGLSVSTMKHAHHAFDVEIGRASCRERVLQYVLIQGVTVTLTKKKNKKKT